MYWICFHPAFLATRSRVSNKEWMAQDDGITEGTKVSRTHPRFPSNPCRPRPYPTSKEQHECWKRST